LLTGLSTLAKEPDMTGSFALRRLAAIAIIAVALIALSTAQGLAQTCPPLPSLATIPRPPAPVLDIWAPAANQAPLLLVTPDPASAFSLLAPVHATLLPPGTLGPNGAPIGDVRVMLFGRAGDRVKAASFVPTPLGQALPAVGVLLTPESIPHLPTETFDDADGNHWYNSDTLFCSGHSPMANGDLFVAGGTELYSITSADGTTTVNLLYGLEYATRYAPFTPAPAQWSKVDASFSPGQSNLPRRWYSAVTRLADSRMLVTSGLDFVTLNVDGPSGHSHVAGTPNRSVEVYDPSTASWRLISTHAHTPAEVWNPDYTHVFPLPTPEFGSAVLMFGGAGVPVYLQPDAPEGSGWLLQSTEVRPGGNAADGRNHGTSSALLPLRVTDGEWGYGNGSVIQAGGSQGSDDRNHIDLYEFCARRWASSSLEMGVTRRHPATVLLPDGRVLIVSGHDDSQPAAAQPDGLRYAQYLTLRPPAPSLATGFSPGGPAGETRGYHNVALLLPDGRVFVAGGRSRSEIAPPDAEDEKAHFRYLYPSYMFAARPVITAAPSTVGYGASFDVSAAGGPISEVVLIGLGSMTHAFDANQRHVQPALAGPPTATGATVIGPPNRQTAPPGYYMLFVLNQANIPSVARIVLLQ